jgi:predicted NUDIX family NTP pyrophosphohydrolase
LYRRQADPMSAAAGIDVLLGHMGGPLWAKKHQGAWTFPKGEREPGESESAAALREFMEETGLTPPVQNIASALDLGLSQTNGKTIQLFALEAPTDYALSGFTPGTFEMIWPPKSGRTQTFPELDRIEWVPLTEAADLLTAGQRPFVDRLLSALT